MVETNTKIITGLTIALLISLGINVQPTDTHFCKIREMTYHCDSLSKYYDLPNGKCVHNLLPNKLCRSGWEEIIREEEIKSEAFVKIKADGKIYKCETDNGFINEFTRCSPGSAYLGEKI